jgi:hypothetical protein
MPIAAGGLIAVAGLGGMQVSTGLLLGGMASGPAFVVGLGGAALVVGVPVAVAVSAC